MENIVVITVLVGMFFLTVGAIGIIRFPDIFSRSHALSLTDTLGALLVLSGLGIHHGLSLNTIKIIIVLALILILNPVISHATVRAAFRAGIRPQSSQTDKVVSENPNGHTRELP